MREMGASGREGVGRRTKNGGRRVKMDSYICSKGARGNNLFGWADIGQLEGGKECGAETCATLFAVGGVSHRHVKFGELEYQIFIKDSMSFAHGDVPFAK